MDLGVVVCPHCHRALVVEIRTAKPACRSCGKGFELRTRTRYYEGDDPEEARRVAGRMALQLGGAGIEAIAESAAAADRERTGSLDEAMRNLERREEFSPADVEDELRRLRVRGTGERVVQALLEANRLFEPRPGRFRWVK